jgi:hypothetical protein
MFNELEVQIVDAILASSLDQGDQEDIYLEVDKSLVAAADPCWDGYKQIGMKKGKDGKMVPNCVPTDTSDDSDDSEFASKKKRTISQTPAPKKDRVKGSKTNPKGSASSGKSKAIKFSARTEKSLSKKVSEHNEKASKGRKVTLGMLKAVYRRGAGAFSGSHRPGMGRDQWAMARVNAFLKLVKSGKPSNSKYITDNDLLPAAHPRSSKKSNSALTASALVPEERDLANAILSVVQKHGKFNEDETGVWAGYTPAAENEVANIGVVCMNCVFYQKTEDGDVCQIISVPIEALGKCRFAVIPDGLVNPDAIDQYMEDKEDLMETVEESYIDAELALELKDQDEYETTEEAILALLEFSGLGYESETAFKATWLRAVRDGDNPFNRVVSLAETTYSSEDSDLLPTLEERI